VQMELEHLQPSQKGWGNRGTCLGSSGGELVNHRACDGGIRTLENY